MLPLQDITWDDLLRPGYTSLLVAMDPLRFEGWGNQMTRAGTCPCTDACKQRVVKMGPRYVLREGYGYRCLNCNKTWWCYRYGPEITAYFLWDRAFNCRVPTNLALFWLTSDYIAWGDEYLRDTDDEYGNPLYFAPPHTIRPDGSMVYASCPAFSTQWPAGLLKCPFLTPSTWPLSNCLALPDATD